MHTYTNVIGARAKALIKLVASCGIGIFCMQSPHAASDWPQKSINFVAPFSPGGGGDTIVRLFAQQLHEELRVPIVVENKPGAGGNIGTAAVAKAAADGHTIVFGTKGTMGTNHFLYKSPGYSLSDFEPVVLFGTTGLLLTVSKDAPFKTLQQLVEYGKSNPGKLSCGSGGNGTISHLACAMLQQQTGIAVEHIPYKGTTAAQVDVMSQRVSFLFDVAPPLHSQIKSGNLLALASSMKKKLPGFESVPTMAEQGYPNFEIFTWDGIFAPKGTPSERLDVIHQAMQRAYQKTEFKEAMANRGFYVEQMSRAEFRKLVQDEFETTGALVKSLNVTLD